MFLSREVAYLGAPWRANVLNESMNRMALQLSFLSACIYYLIFQLCPYAQGPWQYEGFTSLINNYMQYLLQSIPIT